MNLLTIDNKDIIGYNIYDFIKYYQKEINFKIDDNDIGDLFIYEQFFPNQMLQEIIKKRKIFDIDTFFDQSINNFYLKSLNKKINKIYFFYPFSFYSKHDYDFNILEILKQKIEKYFKKEIKFILNNHFQDDNNYLHFNAFRYDMFSNFRETKKIKNEDIKNKIFLSLNAKKRKHRDDLFSFLNENKLFTYFHFSYTQKDIHLWQTNDFSEFGKRYLSNENNSGHLAFEYYLNDDFYNLKNEKYFDSSYYYLITETSCEDNLCFISEKTYKAFYHKIPFIVLGNPFTLKNLKKEGFKTFDNWIDESYDEEINYEKRKNKIFNEIKRLCYLSEKKHQIFLQEMKNTLEYNSKHFLDISNFRKDFLKIYS